MCDNNLIKNYPFLPCRIFNHDETPQFINYGVDGTPNGLVYAGRGDACQKMIRENRECVTIHPFVSFDGDIAICHVIFKGKGISEQMAPELAVQNIQNLLISTNDSGSQDHTTLLAAYKTFDAYLEESNITRPVVVLSDGHSSRFDLDVLTFLQNKQIKLYITPPDTTGVTQLLDQVNQKLHHEYRNSRSEMFSSSMTINREGFMTILADFWSDWAPRETIVGAGKRVGVSNLGLSVEWMQHDKFERAAACMDLNPDTQSSSQVPSSSTLVINSPIHIRNGSASYWKHKFKQAMEAYSKNSEQSLQIEDVPGLLKINKVKPKTPKDNVRVTQVHGSMEGKQILEKVAEIKRDKLEKEKSKENVKLKHQEKMSAFHRCKQNCVCEAKPCEAKGLRECPQCHNILQSVCSKASCKDTEGSRPIMVKPFCDWGNPRKHLKFGTSSGIEEEEEEESGEESSDGDSFDDVEDADMRDEEERVEDFHPGEYVKVIGGAFVGYYAVVTSEGYGDEVEVNYFEKKGKWWTLKEYDLDSREKSELQKVVKVDMDHRSHYYFS